MSEHPDLWHSWQDLMAVLGRETHQSTYEELIAAYSESHRCYHNLQHLRECLGLVEQVRALLIRPVEVELALWFHDAVYQPRSLSNEINSAAWAKKFLGEAGVDEAIAKRVLEYILATQTHKPSTRLDGQFVLDIDLAILGSSPTRFRQFESQIRQEYQWVPIAEYCYRRITILQQFLAKDMIYQTRFFCQPYEDRARRNIEWVITQFLNDPV